MQIYITKNGQQFGPIEENKVIEMLQIGQLSPNDLGIRQGQNQWSTLGNMFPNVQKFSNTPTFPVNNQPQVILKKNGSSKTWLFTLLGIGGLFFIGIFALAAFFVLFNKKTTSTNLPTKNPANSSSNSTNSKSLAPTDFSAMKAKAEELAKLSPPLKPDSKSKLKGKIAVVQKGEREAELKGYGYDYKQLSDTDISFFGLSKEMLAKTPEEIDSLVQVVCIKGRLIGRYEGNILGYANNCKVSLIDYRNKNIFAQKSINNTKPEKSVSSAYDGGDYIMPMPSIEIWDYVKGFAPDKVEVSTTDVSSLPNIEDKKTFAASPDKFGQLNFPAKLDSNATIKGKVTIIQTDYMSMMIGLDSEGNFSPLLPNSIILTKESLGFTNEQLATKSSEIDTLIQVNCKKGSLITKTKGISVYSNLCTVSIVDYKGLATVAHNTFEAKTVDPKRYSDPSIYDDKQDTVAFPRTEIEEYIKQFPKS